MAIGYVYGADDALLTWQRTEVARYVEAEGLALAEMLHDTGDGFTISQIVEAAQLLHARQVLLPADAHLADAHARLTLELSGHGAVCVVIGTRTRHSPESHVTDMSPARTTMTAVAAPHTPE